MHKIYNLIDNPNITLLEQIKGFAVLEYKKDCTNTLETAASEYFASKMNIHRRQLLCDLSQGSVVTQAGSMQMMFGDVTANTGIKGASDLFGKMVKGKVSNESAIKPEYSTASNGKLLLEPTYKHILLLDVNDWGQGVVIEDGSFLAGSTSLERNIIHRQSISSALAGGEGLFNLSFSGNGVLALESNYPMQELIVVDLENDTLRVDGDFAIAWSSSLQFTVERSTKSLAGSAVAGEGLVNVYRGTGRVILSTNV